MKDLRPGFVRAPTPLASMLIALSVLPLPATSRDRWSDECRAELVELPIGRQVAAAAGALAGSFALRAALKADTDDVAATPMSCRMRRHRYLVVAGDNPENRGYHYRECVVCGKIKEAKGGDYERVDRPFMGGGGLL